MPTTIAVSGAIKERLCLSVYNLEPIMWIGLKRLSCRTVDWIGSDLHEGLGPPPGRGIHILPSLGSEFPLVSFLDWCILGYEGDLERKWLLDRPWAQIDMFICNWILHQLFFLILNWCKLWFLCGLPFLLTQASLAIFSMNRGLRIPNNPVLVKLLNFTKCMINLFHILLKWSVQPRSLLFIRFYRSSQRSLVILFRIKRLQHSQELHIQLIRRLIIRIHILNSFIDRFLIGATFIGAHNERVAQMTTS